MASWQAMMLILEQGTIIVVLLWFGVRFGRWSASRHRLTDSTNALIEELQKHRSTDVNGMVNNAVIFVHDDRQESA